MEEQGCRINRNLISKGVVLIKGVPSPHNRIVKLSIVDVLVLLFFLTRISIVTSVLSIESLSPSVAIVIFSKGLRKTFIWRRVSQSSGESAYFPIALRRFFTKVST